MTDEVELPATVAAYLRDPAVHTAVEALLTIEADALPPGLEWDELDTYYRARGGAELTRHDMAHFLHLLWKAIWGDQIGPHWQSVPLGALVDEGYELTPETIWKEKSFAVRHQHGRFRLYTGVTLEPRSLSLAFSVEDDEEEVVLILEDFEPFRWRDDDVWSGWQVHETRFASRGELPALAPLRAIAATAIAAADHAVPSSRIA